MLVYKKAWTSVSVAARRTEASRIALSKSDDNVQKPRLYAMAASRRVPRETLCRMARNHISTGVYRCQILDFDMKFCENFCSSRTSADIRFSKKSADPPTMPVTGLLRSGLHGKVTHLFAFSKYSHKKSHALIHAHCRLHRKAHRILAEVFLAYNERVLPLSAKMRNFAA